MQLEFRTRPKPTQEDAERVLWWLSTAAQNTGEWMTRKELESVTCLPDRAIRQIAADNPDKIISGQRGYKYLPAATAEELRECIGRLKSQGREMLRRAIKTKRAWHKLPRRESGEVAGQ